MYTVDDLIDERNSELYKCVSTHYRIALKESKDRLWTSRIESQMAIIGVTDSQWPCACFAHELLHIKFRIDGQRCPKWKNQENIPNISDLVAFFFNIFEHVKMYPDFIKLRYNPEQFLNDHDRRDVGTIHKDVLKLEAMRATRKKIPALAIAMPAAVLLSPPVVSVSDGYMNRLRVLDSTLVNKLEQLFTDWAESDSVDLRAPFARLFRICGFSRIGFH